MHDDVARRESEYNRGTGCGKTARPGLCGGRLVTGVPTVRGVLPHQRTGAEVPGMGCRLAGFVPDETAGRVRHPVTGGSLAAGT
jgi:hypothetical protein